MYQQNLELNNCVQNCTKYINNRSILTNMAQTHRLTKATIDLANDVVQLYPFLKDQSEPRIVEYIVLDWFRINAFKEQHQKLINRPKKSRLRDGEQVQPSIHWSKKSQYYADKYSDPPVSIQNLI